MRLTRRDRAGTIGDLSLDSDRLLRIYLNDHLAGAAAGTALAKRCARANEDDPLGRYLAGPFLGDLADEQRYVEAVMRSRGWRINPVKRLVGRLGEFVGRAKMNGRVRGYSPLSRVIEVEMLIAGVDAKSRMWSALRAIDGRDLTVDDLDPGTLLTRAHAQRDRLREAHVDAVRIAFSRRR